MALWGDTKGRFAFTPNALHGASPYIDRLQVDISIPAPFLEDHRFAEFLDTLSGTLFSARNGYEAAIYSGWLFAGTIRLSRARSGRESNEISIVINLNPTRFLQAHNVPSTVDARRGILSHPRINLRRSDGAAHTERLLIAERLSFDRNDNFLTHHDTVHGPVLDWSTRTSEYLEACYSLIREEIIFACRQLLGANFNADYIPRFDRASCRLSSIEFYWEYAVDNSIAKVHEVSKDFRAILRDAFQTEFRVVREREFGEGRERNSPFVKGLLGHADISAKLYAKASHVVRFEVTFQRQPLRTLTGDRSLRFGRLGGATLSLEQQLEIMGDEASSRSSNFWNDFWQRMHLAPQPERATIFRLLERLFRAAENSAVSVPELISMLVEGGGLESFGASGDEMDPIARLRRDRILTRITSAPNRRARYQFRSDLMPLINLLTTNPNDEAHELDLGDTSLLQHEEKPSVRIRPRSYNRLQIE